MTGKKELVHLKNIFINSLQEAKDTKTNRTSKYSFSQTLSHSYSDLLSFFLFFTEILVQKKWQCTTVCIV